MTSIRYLAKKGNIHFSPFFRRNIDVMLPEKEDNSQQRKKLFNFSFSQYKKSGQPKIVVFPIYNRGIERT